MIQTPQQVAAKTTHTRRGGVRHSFTYAVDFVLIDPESDATGPSLFSRNRFNLSSVHDIDHGGPLKQGRGAAWAREVLSKHGLTNPSVRLLLLTQPRTLGYVFNPVSFWLAFDSTDLIAAIAEVSTPFGDRHSYLCHLPSFAPITSESRMETPKSLHVSPFQEIAGKYKFAFDIREDFIDIRIMHRNGAEGVVASLTGQRRPMTNSALIMASISRPMGALRTMILIHWQALRLKLKGARYRTRPNPPKTEVT